MTNPYSIRTRSGNFLDFSDPNPADINLEDIAVALSRAPRFNGHTGPFYSVAQHSVFVGRMMGNDPIRGYLHDASEAYLADVPTPAKRLMPDYYALEKKVMTAVAAKFGLKDGFQHDDDVAVADSNMLFLERDAMIDDQIEWMNEHHHPGFTIKEVFPDWKPWDSATASVIFYNEVLARLPQ